MFSVSVLWSTVLIQVVCSASATNSSDHFENFAQDILEEEHGKIIHTSVIFRHGNRNPYAPYPFDPYKDYEWQEGLGQLTNAGKKKLYETGKWFRKRYADLIGDRYYYEDIKVESSDYERTIMSAQCLLAGLYPPSEIEQWNEEGLHWQPIPVHTIPLEEDNLISMFKNCEVYNIELFTANSAPKFKELYRKNAEFFNYVGMSTGIVFNENFIIYALLKLMEIYDTLNVQFQNDFELPPWSDTVFPQPMTSLAIELFELGTYTDKMKRLKSGPLFKSIITDMQKKVNEEIFNQNIHLYSGHDSTIATIMLTLGIFNKILPPYGSALLFELREKENKHYVTVLYRNSSLTAPLLMEIPTCKSPCSLEDFASLTKNFMTNDWDEECKIQMVIPELPLMQPDEYPFNTNQMIILVLVIILILLTVAYYSIKRRKNQCHFMPLKTRGKPRQD